MLNTNIKEGKMKCGGCGCNKFSQHICRQVFCKSVDCNDNRLEVKGPVVGSGIDPAGYINLFPIKKIQESPCYWNLDIDGVTGSGSCQIFNNRFVVETNGPFGFCDKYNELTPFDSTNTILECTQRMFLAGDDPLQPGSGVWNGIDSFCSASGYNGPRPRIWHEIRMIGQSVPDGQSINMYDYGSTFNFNRYYYADSNIIYSGDYRIDLSTPGQYGILIDVPDCDSYYDTGSIDCNELDITFSGYRLLQETNINSIVNSGCFYCDYSNMTCRITPYSGISTDYYNRSTLPLGIITDSDIHVSGGYSDILISFSGIISEIDIIPSSQYNKSTCDCNFLNRTFKHFEDIPRALDNRNRLTICCECESNGSPCIDNIFGYFESFIPSGQPTYMRGSRLVVEINGNSGVYASFEREFANHASGTPSPLDIGTLQNLNIPYVSGFVDQSKCYANSGTCSISAVETRYNRCVNNSGCNSFCDYTGPNELLFSIPNNFYSVISETYQCNYRSIDFPVGQSGTLKYGPLCNDSGVFCQWAQISGHYEYDFFGHLTRYDFWLPIGYSDRSTCNATPSGNNSTYQQCVSKVSLMTGGNYILNRVAPCVYEYSGTNPQYWEVDNISVTIAKPNTNGDRLGFDLNIKYGNGLFLSYPIAYMDSICRNGTYIVINGCPSIGNMNDIFSINSSYRDSCGIQCFPSNLDIDVPIDLTENCFFKCSGYINIQGII